MSTLKPEHREPLAEFLLAVADDKLMLGHRNSDWTGLAPILEEDIAFSALAQDDIAHALQFYQLAADLRDTTPDALAYGRRPADYRCAAIVEQPDDFDWALAICRQFLCDHYYALVFERLRRSSHAPLAALAARVADEQRIHLEHVDAWMVRLGRGTNESRERMQKAMRALEDVAPMLFEPTEGQPALESAGLYPPLDADMFDRWSTDLKKIAEASGLELSLRRPRADPVGGRRGHHTADFAPMLEELTEVYRVEPGAEW